jgi:hypothetical protein
MIRSYQLQYHPGGYVVYYKLLRGLNAALPFLTFDIKGTSGGEKPKVGINDGRGHEPKIEIGEYLPSGITTSPQTVRIPLLAFTRAITDWTQLHSISFALEQALGNNQGAICIDNIRFEPDALPLSVDLFDGDNENGVGLHHGVDTAVEPAGTVTTD